MIKRLIPSVVFGLALLLLPGLVWAQQGVITGTVTELETGAPLPGATVQVVDEGSGAATDSDGQYRITGAPAGEQTIRVSFVGFQTEDRTVNVPEGGTVRANFQLEQQATQLEEVVRVGYGQKEREQVLGSISSVSSAEIQDIGSVSSPQQLLQGQPGVNVTTTSGLAGQAVNVSVRGVSTLNSGASPLYVVDGTPVTTGATGGGYGQTTNALSQIAPQNIESIEVLKGASATAIYGSRASNGVVLIQTKEGAAGGETRVSASYQIGAVKSTSEYDEVMVNGPQFLTLHDEAAENSTGLPNGVPVLESVFAGLDIPDDVAQDFSQAETYPWLEEAKETGIAQTANLSIRGGDQNTQFFVSGVFSRDESYVITNQFNRFAGRVNVTHDVRDWMRVGTKTSITRTENFQVASDNLVAAPLTSAALMAPTTPIRNEAGGFNFSNPWSIADNVIGSANLSTNTIRNWRVLSTSFLEVQPHESLTLRGEFGIDALVVDDFDRDHRLTTDGAPNGAGWTNYEEQRRYTFRGTATYDRTFSGRHDMNVILGTSIEDQRRDDLAVGATAFPSAAFQNVSSAASPNTTAFGVFRKEGLMSFFGRATYTLDSKYIFEGSLRWDGSSRFGSESRWGRFGSLSAGYRIGEEDFMQQYDWLSSLKLRGSLGWIGNNDIANSFHPAVTQAGGGADYNEEPGVSITSLGNPDLQWESTRSIEGGLDLGLFNDRIFLTSTYFRSLTTNLITDRALPTNSGFSSITQNRGQLFNEGVELSLETQNVVGEFNWSTSLNFTWKQNEVQDLPGGEPILSGAQRAIEGKEVGFYMREYIGVDSETGAPLWRGPDGEPTSNYGQAVESFQGGILPNYTGGLTNNMNYKGFDLRFSLNFEAGSKIYNATKAFLLQYAGFGIHEDALDRWQEPGDETDVPRATLADGNSAASESSRFLEDADWLRLSNVTFGYTLPSNLTSQFGVDQLRLYFQGSNLYTFESLSIGDPEGTRAGASNVLNRGELFFTPPLQRTFTGGVRMQF